MSNVGSVYANREGQFDSSGVSHISPGTRPARRADASSRNATSPSPRTRCSALEQLALLIFVADFGSSKHNYGFRCDALEDLDHTRDGVDVPDIDANTDDARPFEQEGFHNLEGLLTDDEFPHDRPLLQRAKICPQVPETKRGMAVTGIQRGENDVYHVTFVRCVVPARPRASLPNIPIGVLRAQHSLVTYPCDKACDWPICMLCSCRSNE